MKNRQSLEELRLEEKSYLTEWQQSQIWTVITHQGPSVLFFQITKSNNNNIHFMPFNKFRQLETRDKFRLLKSPLKRMMAQYFNFIRFKHTISSRLIIVSTHMFNTKFTLNHVIKIISPLMGSTISSTLNHSLKTKLSQQKWVSHKFSNQTKLM